MNAKQKSLGALLLLLNFAFPYTQYPVKESSEDGLSVKFTTHTAFIPIWSAQEAHERAPLKDNPFSDTRVLWDMVAIFATIILVVSSWLCYQSHSCYPKSNR